jgi:hypothetical protein
MGKLIAATLVACGLNLSGCATGPYEWKYGQDKIVPGQFSMTNTDKTGTVLTWPSHAVAAIVYPNGDAACVQSAQSSKARNMSGGGGISAMIAPGQSVDAKMAQAITEAVASLQDRNDVATFLDVALFQICAISRNSKFTKDQTAALIQQAFVTSADIAKARPSYVKKELGDTKADAATLTHVSVSAPTLPPTTVTIPPAPEANGTNPPPTPTTSGQ